MKRFFTYHNTTDFINTIFFVLLAVSLTVWSYRIPSWWQFALADLLIVTVIQMLAKFAASRGQRWSLVHGFYMMALIPIAFKQMYLLVPAIHPVDFDAALMAIDRALFGCDVTVWIHQFAQPWLTEVLQMAYASYYLLPFILVVDFFLKKRMKAFKSVFMLVMLGFYLSYIGYVAVPAIGPRFTQHDFANTDADLPGLLVTSALRVYTNSGESIPPGTAYPAADVQRDVFPSGHTEVTLLVMLLAFRYRARTRWYLTVVGTLLVLATVYLRYHYVIDLIGGAVFAWLTLEVGPIIDRWFVEWKKRHALPVENGVE
ncbi:MAG: phosphatase PAP2 family protein [Bacteroidetes bacterium]|nr:phosphatase PAP2 family protein [Bacteroidota bacterium]